MVFAVTNSYMSVLDKQEVQGVVVRTFLFAQQKAVDNVLVSDVRYV